MGSGRLKIASGTLPPAHGWTGKFLPFLALGDLHCLQRHSPRVPHPQLHTKAVARGAFLVNVMSGGHTWQCPQTLSVVTAEVCGAPAIQGDYKHPTRLESVPTTQTYFVQGVCRAEVEDIQMQWPTQRAGIQDVSKGNRVSSQDSWTPAVPGTVRAAPR